MIRLNEVSKAYRTPQGTHLVLNGISCTIPPRKNLGIVGRNGSGKSTLLRVLAGVEQPDAGRVERTGSVSWPIGFSGGFNGSLNGEENCRFVARIYGHEVDRVVEFARDFAGIGQYFYNPVRTYSSGMKARLAFGLSMAVDFDYYLVDEVTAVGDADFQNKCREAFRERQDRSSVIIVSHQLKTIRSYCESFAILKAGHLTVYDDFQEAAAVYQGLA